MLHSTLMNFVIKFERQGIPKDQKLENTAAKAISFSDFLIAAKVFVLL